MKFTTVLAFVFVFVAASVSATPFRETNGERMARGLPPLPPQKRSGTPVYAAKRTGPSSSPGQCTTGPVQCCNSVGTADDSVIGLILGLLGIVLGDGVLAGVGCSPITVIGASSSSCSAQTVCCEDNSSSLISIGCIPNHICPFY
ncbi:fungal hydrophobin [Lentinula edodes]|nr:fungal hydrophobin [Lentinula edodes]